MELSPGTTRRMACMSFSNVEPVNECRLNNSMTITLACGAGMKNNKWMNGWRVGASSPLVDELSHRPKAHCVPSPAYEIFPPQFHTHIDL